MLTLRPKVLGFKSSSGRSVDFSGYKIHVHKSLREYVSDLQLHEDLEVPYIAEHISTLALSFNSKIPDAEILVVQQLDRMVC